MASIVASAVMDAVLDKLNGLIVDKFCNLIGVPKDIAFLKDELSVIRALLNNLEDTNGELNPLVKNWRDQAREMAFDIEDIIDDFMNKQESADVKAGFLNKLSHCLKTCRDHHETASQIKELKTRLQEMHERRKRIRVEPNSSPSTTIDPRVSALFNEGARLVGIDGPKKELLNQVVRDPSQQLKVLSIVGFGGLGKTTLANAVYREVGGQFDCTAFVSVSQKPTMTTVLNGLLSKLTHNTSPPHTCSVEELISKLRTYLLDKKYLIVVDDLWTVPEWEHAISCALPQNNKRSRVIVTTRDARVATACSNHYGRFIYNMKSLSDQDSRKLFFNRIFRPDQICPPELEDVSVEILKKCSGLPLAIITIASILACAGSSISQKMQWEFIKKSLATQLPTNNPTWEGMMYILNLSYKSLPPHLKQCFLYLGIYPEDYTIIKDELVTAWVAEGFVSEDMAEGYFDELVNRSVIQPAFEWETCDFWKVHDMMLDLILRICEEDNFMTVSHNLAREVVESPRYKVRRLSVNLRGVKDCRIPITLGSHLSHLRSLTLFGTSGWIPPLSEFKFLRVLFIYIGGTRTTLDLTDISQLSLLRYLWVGGLVDAVSIVLPGQIRRLRHLEVFDLPWESMSNCNIPSDIVDLPRLSHLTGPISSTLPEGIGKAKSLHTMYGFCLLKSSLESIEGLGELTNLQKLRICIGEQYPRTDRWMTALGSSLEKLSNLKWLMVDCHSNVHFCADAVSRCPSLKLEQLYVSSLTFSRVPTWMGGLRNVRELKLGVMQILQEDANMIGTRLQSLVDLTLRIPGVTAERIVISGSMGFSVLKRMYLDWDGMSSLTFEVGGMPELEELDLCFTPQPQDEWDGAIPAGLQHLSKLKKIYAWTVGIVSRETEEQIKSVFHDHAADHPNHPAVVVVSRRLVHNRCPEVGEDGQEREVLPALRPCNRGNGRGPQEGGAQQEIRIEYPIP